MSEWQVGERVLLNEEFAIYGTVTKWDRHTLEISVDTWPDGVEIPSGTMLSIPRPRAARPAQ